MKFPEKFHCSRDYSKQAQQLFPKFREHNHQSLVILMDVKYINYQIFRTVKCRIFKYRTLNFGQKIGIWVTFGQILRTKILPLIFKNLSKLAAYIVSE